MRGGSRVAMGHEVKSVELGGRRFHHRIILFDGGFDEQFPVFFHLGAEQLAAWDAQSFAPLLTENDQAATQHRDHLVVSQLAQTCQRSVMFKTEGREFVYTTTYRSSYYDFPPEMLFDLKSDPPEKENCADRHPALRSAARSNLVGIEEVLR